MQKLLSALVAIMSFAGMLSGIAVAPVTAQDRPPVTGRDETAPGSTNPAEASPLVLPPGITHEDVEVKNRPLIIEGDVKGSVHAVNSDVTMMPGAKVEGNLSLEGGSLSVAPAAATMISSTALRAAGLHATTGGVKRGDWFGGQFCLWLLGLAGGLIVLVAAPNATSRVAETVSMRPGRSLLVGLAIAAGMFSALAVSGMILHSGSVFSLLWMPVTILIALVSLVLLVFGWLAGMRRVGDMLARRFGKTDSGTFYGRMTFGLTAFFLFNAIAGGIVPPLGAVGLLAEFAIALMGVGAIVQTGFGRTNEHFSHSFGRFPGSGLS